MNPEELNIIMERGESIRTEFKTSFSEDVIISLVAFSNAKGGVVYIGIDNSGEIRGIQLSKETAVQWVNEIKGKTAPSIVPDIEILTIKGKQVVALSVIEYPVKPVSARGRYYKRVGNSNHLLSVTEVVNLHLKTVNSSWDFYPRENKTLNDISLDKVQKLIETINRRNSSVITDDPLTFLRKFQLISGESITHACWLLFMPATDVCTTVELGRFSSSTIIKDSITLQSDLFTEADEIMDFIRKHINKQVILKGKLENEERWDYPMEALRELVLNMVVHRDYTSSYDSVLKIFDDHIEFYNPGALPAEIGLQNLVSDNYVSQPRNKLIAEIFKASGLIEKYGSGIKRVLEAFVKRGLPQPDFQLLPSGFRVLVFAESYPKPSDRLGDELGDKLGDKLGNNQKLILDAIRHNPDVSLSQLSKIVGISQTAIENNITRLKKNGLLKRIGPAKGGHWEVAKSLKNHQSLITNNQ